jgi:hypothetical protein
MPQAQPAPSDSPTFRLTSRLMFLHVTVLDKKGRPVVKGLTKDDFTITESKKPQLIFSFEAPTPENLLSRPLQNQKPSAPPSQ